MVNLKHGLSSAQKLPHLWMVLRTVEGGQIQQQPKEDTGGWLRLWLRCRGLRSWLARLCRTEFFKFGLGRKAFGKVFLIFRQTRANQAAVGERKTVLRHLFHRLLRSPALLGHAIGGDHHSGAVITYTAVNEDFLAWVFSDQGEKVRKNSVLRE